MIEELPFTIAAIRAAYAEGLRPETVVAEVYRRIESAGDPGIFLHLVDRADAVSMAVALGDFDPERPLWGMPFAVKDNIDVAGCPTTAACPAFSLLAGCRRLFGRTARAAGAIPIGKTNLDQFATGLVGVQDAAPGAAECARPR